MRSTGVKQRPDIFTLNPFHPWMRDGSLALFGGGNARGGLTYHDSSRDHIGGQGGNHGTLTNFAWPNTATSGWGWDSTLKRPVLNIDGSDDYVSISNVLQAQIASGTFTIGLWFYSNSTSGIRGLFSSDVTPPYPFALYTNETTLYWLTNGSLRISIANVTTGMWHYAAVTSAAGMQVLYLDAASNSGGPFAITPNSDVVSIGREYQGIGRTFLGGISDCCVFSKRLSPAEISALFNPAWSIDYGGLILPLWQRVYAVAVAGGDTFTATGACTAKRATASGSGSFTVPAYTAIGSCTAKRATADGSATFTVPTYTGAGSCTARKATAAGVGTHTAPAYTAIGTCTAKQATASGAAAFTAPTYTGEGACTARKATAGGSGTFTVPTYAGVGAATARKATANGTGTFVPRYQGIGAATAKKATAAGSGSFAAPVHLGVGTATARKAQCEGSGLSYVYLYTGTGVLVARDTVCAGVGTFTPKSLGPYVVSKTAMFLPGALTGEVFTPGSQKDGVFLPGALTGEVITS